MKAPSSVLILFLTVTMTCVLCMASTTDSIIGTWIETEHEIMLTAHPEDQWGHRWVNVISISPTLRNGGTLGGTYTFIKSDGGSHEFQMEANHGHYEPPPKIVVTSDKLDLIVSRDAKAISETGTVTCGASSIYGFPFSEYGVLHFKKASDSPQGLGEWNTLKRQAAGETGRSSSADLNRGSQESPASKDILPGTFAEPFSHRWIRFQSDGTFFLHTQADKFWGTWKRSGTRISVRSQMGLAEEFTINGYSIVDTDGTHWSRTGGAE